LQFQTEVNNYINYAFRDIGIKDSVKLAKLFVYANLTNNVFEVMMNRRPLLDPIDAAIDAFQEGDLVKGAGRMTGEALSNMPGGQLLANIYPIYGMKILGMKLPTREKFFGRSEAGRFGPIPLSGVTNNPMTSVVTPFGGSQLRKTYTGAKAIAEGGVYQEARSKNVFAQKKKRFGINNPLETAKALTFGPYATSAAKEYFEKPKIRKRTF